MKTIKISDMEDPDAYADWLKKIENGKYQKQDLEATKEALANYLKRQKKV